MTVFKEFYVNMRCMNASKYKFFTTVQRRYFEVNGEVIAYLLNCKLEHTFLPQHGNISDTHKVQIADIFGG